ncbi:helix-turn-helix domain-containing protein [Bosea eneae]|uniref:Helix-turn-helix domain-containing protein n=1 Tax=Bosea eneae TaxID=151454 RepID=A0ABW0J0L3_9HYPH
MSAPVPKVEYDSFGAFYAEVYGHAVREVRPAGHTGAVMLLTDQEAGDWSDAPTPDLVVARVTHGRVSIAADLGAGRFSASQSAHDFILIAPGAGSRIQVHGDHTCQALGLPYAALRGLAQDQSKLPADGDFGRVHEGVQRDAEITRLLDRVWAEGAAGSPHGALWVDGALLQLTSALLRLRDGRMAARSHGLSPWQLRRVTEFLDADLAADRSLAELAELVGLSPNHFCVAFRRSAGRPPHRWLVARRVEKARVMLADARFTVTEVALACGFASSAHFATTFRKHVGVSPSAWRRERLS